MFDQRPAPHRADRWVLNGAVATALALSLAGCGSPPRPAPVAPVATPAPQRPVVVPAAPVAAASAPAAPVAVPAEPSPLLAEANWLKELFNPTPVRVQEEADGSVRLSVPLVHSFEGATATTKPAIKGVLDKLVLSLKRQPSARLQISTPGPQADARASALRAYLNTKGITAWRLAPVQTVAGDAVQLRLMPGSGPVKRLDDNQLPPPPPPATPSTPTSASPAAAGNVKR